MANYDSIYQEEYNKYLGDTERRIANAQTQAEESLKKSYDASKSKLDSSRQDALKQAYITKRLAQRDAPEQMAKHGLSGGYTESNLASIERAYANNRNAAQKTYDENLTSLDIGYNGDLASLRNSYLDMINAAKQNAASQALTSAAQRYNALKAEEEAAAASSAGSSYGYSGSASRTSASPVSSNSNTGAGYGTVSADSVYTGKGSYAPTNQYNGYGATKGFTGTRIETRNGRRYSVTYQNGLQTGQKLL